MIPDLIYDVGMHKGEDTDYYLKKGFRVVAIEADPKLIAHCRLRFSEAIADGQLVIIEGVVAPQSVGVTVPFFRNASASEWGTIEVAWADRNLAFGCPSEIIDLPRIDPAEIFATHGVPFYLKVDIEGADLIFIQYLKGSSTRPRFISLESSLVSFDRVRSEIDMLRDLGYSKFKAVQQVTIPGTKIETYDFRGCKFVHVFEECSSGAFGDEILQPWLTEREILDEYQKIFTRYKYFGNHTAYSQMPDVIRRLISALYKGMSGYRGTLTGWYDTHASL